MDVTSPVVTTWLTVVSGETCVELEQVKGRTLLSCGEDVSVAGADLRGNSCAIVKLYGDQLQ